MLHDGLHEGHLDGIFAAQVEQAPAEWKVHGRTWVAAEARRTNLGLSGLGFFQAGIYKSVQKDFGCEQFGEPSLPSHARPQYGFKKRFRVFKP